MMLNEDGNKPRGKTMQMWLKTNELQGRATMFSKKVCYVTCLLCLLCVTNCTIKSIIKFSATAPPMFTVTGQPREFFFTISEVSPENYDATPWNNNSQLNRKLWQLKIRPGSASFLGETLGLTLQIPYGKAPQELEQVYPVTGPPETLQSGKVYEVTGGSTCCENVPQIIWFKIEQGKAVIFKE